MKKTLIFALFVIGIVVSSPGQSWLKTYCDTGGFGGAFAVETYDKGFLTGGSSSKNFENAILYKTDINGNILWQRVIGVSGSNTHVDAICVTPDGGCAIAGDILKPKTNNETFLLKLNACGEMDWAKIFSDMVPIVPSSIYLMKDGGFVFNMEKSSNRLAYAGLVYRTDKSGNLVWLSRQNNLPVNLFVDDSDNILVTGHFYSQYYHDAQTIIPYNSIKVLKLDSTGKPMMNGNSEDFDNIGQQTLPAPGGNYLTCGTDIGGNDIFDLHLFIWDYKGLLVHNIAISDPSNTTSPQDMVRTGDSDYIVLAVQFNLNGSGYNMKTIKITRDTAVLKDTVYHYGHTMYPSTIRPTSDGKYITAGSVMNGNDSVAMYMLKINSQLEPDSIYNAKYDYDSLCGNMKDTETISLDNAPVKYLGIDENTDPSESFFIYPNPARDFVNISCSGFGGAMVQFSLFNILGVKIMSSEFRPDLSGNLSQQISLQKIPEGCYFVELSQGNKGLRQKIIIQ